jgi:hypothetical protein
VEPVYLAEPPLPPGDEQRARFTRLCRRMLYGMWGQDLQERIVAELGHGERAGAWGLPDTSGNLYKAVTTHLASLYTPEGPCVAPVVTPAPPEYTAGPDGELEPYGAERVIADVQEGARAVVDGSDDVVRAVEAAGLWELLVRGHRDTIGLREMFYRFDADSTGPGANLAIRPVYPDMVHAMSGSSSDVPAYVAEARWLPGPSGRSEWVWEVWDARTEWAPERYDTDNNGRVLRAYPWRDYDAAGRPVIPYALRHAERTGYLFDPYELYEIIEASLSLGVKWTYFGHLIRSASWPQRYTAGVRLASSEVEDGYGTTAAGTERPRTRRVRVETDPSYVLDFEVDPDSTVPPIIGQWAASSDPEKVANAITAYERRIGALAGLEPAQIQRASGDPRSGYAIAVSRDEQTKHQRRFSPSARRADYEALRVAAAVLGSARGQAYPAAGYAVEYAYEREDRRRKAAEAAIREQQRPNAKANPAKRESE